jgi:hypothetical protein
MTTTTYQLLVSGKPLLSADRTSAAVIFNNLSGANYADRGEHYTNYLADMAGDFLEDPKAIEVGMALELQDRDGGSIATTTIGSGRRVRTSDIRPLTPAVNQCEGERVTKPYEPDWDGLDVICSCASVDEAMDRFYKSDRLNRPGGTRERLIADRALTVEQHGFDCLASHHDSVNGRALYIRSSKGRFTVLSCAARK